MAKSRYLLDVNVLIARVFEDHEHHDIARSWINARDIQWALCPFTEAGFLRYATSPSRGNLSMSDATAILERLAQHPGYQYHPLSHDWRTLTKPFFGRLHGHKQVTDAYLLGLAVQADLVLATFDSSILHLAGSYQNRVLVLGQG